jgi:hypothetical protein
MSHTAVYSIPRRDRALERACAELYRQAQHDARQAPGRRANADFVLAVCNAATWLYTLTSLLGHV